MTQAQLLTPWSTGVQPHPPFILANAKLLSRIREVRIDAAAKIQCLAETEFHRQSAKLGKEGETLITTLEAMSQGKSITALDDKLSQTALFVGRTKATLQTKLENRRILLASRQPTSTDWAVIFIILRHIDAIRVRESLPSRSQQQTGPRLTSTLPKR